MATESRPMTLERVRRYLQRKTGIPLAPRPPALLPASNAAAGFVDARALSEKGPFDAAAWHARGREAHLSGDLDGAYVNYATALAIVHRHHPSLEGLREIARIEFEAGAKLLRDGDRERARRSLVRAIEADPDNEAIGAALAPLAESPTGYDLTRQCFVFYDPQRAERIHRETVLRVMEYVSIAGVVGDVLEFGVLGGWSARIFCETMRHLRTMARIHLFDSFEGLPQYDSAVDRESYEIGGRNLWQDRMRFPDDFVAALGGSVDGHIRRQLSGIVREERIAVYKGFYSETLAADLPLRASVVHVDCDLYQSTVEVLTGLYRMDALQDGCVIMFDDWNLNKASPNYGERRAFDEFLAAQDRYAATPFFTYGFNGAAFFLHDRQA